jgi:SAM-dependent methyltransferase
MENVVVSSQSKFLDRVLSDVNFENKVVLDAGTGGWSARFLAQREPGKIVCVAGPGDMRKEEEARNALQSIDYKNYQIILGNLICENLFPANSFDFIFAHYLIEEVDGFAPLGICEVLHNLHKFLREGGELVIVNPEAYVPFRPEYKLTSTIGIQGDAQLEKRSKRDLIDALYILLFTPATLMLLSNLTGGRYPSKWICNWLTDAGFKELETHFFDTKVYVDKDFTQRSTFARQIISTMCAPKLREGLLEILEGVVSEYKRRNVTEDDFFLQRHYVICAKKGL